MSVMAGDVVVGLNYRVDIEVEENKIKPNSYNHSSYKVGKKALLRGHESAGGKGRFSSLQRSSIAISSMISLAIS